jgi:hypothetical protein
LSRNKHTASSLLGKIGPRAALYAGVPLLEHYGGQMMGNRAENAKLKEVLQQLHQR